MNPAPFQLESSPTPSRESLAAISCSVSLPVPFYDRDGITIYHGDCRQILPLLERFDLLMADPPYGIGADKAMHKASGNVVGHGHRRVAKRTYEASDWDKEPGFLSRTDIST